MNPLRSFLFLFGLPVVALAVEATAPAPRHPIVWDAMEKVIAARPGDGAADFVFKATNTSNRPITITSVRPSCGCTVVAMPAAPWVLAPGGSGVLHATVNISGKDGMLTKSLAVDSSEGLQTLVLRVDIAPPDEPMRQRNQQVARENRQAVFRGECASCHVTPGQGQKGEALFASLCGVCHFSPHRASIVPDLLTAREPRDAAWWRNWIGGGRDGTLMPAFAEKNGGPLSTEQIESLVEFALSHLPTEPKKD